MKLKIIKNKNGKKIGYELIAETVQETQDLNFIRPRCYSDIPDEEKMVYASRKIEESSPAHILTLKFIIKKHF